MNPFGGSEKISGLGEKGLISRICAAFGGAVPPPPFGAGDDCAVVPSEKFCGRKMLATSDAVIFGRHFDESSEPSLVGRKLVNRNVSDIASMGGIPLYALTSGILSSGLSVDWLEEFCRGAAEAAQKFGIKIVGGDVARADGKFFSMHMALIGAAPEKPMLRSGARIGDAIYVSGEIGLSFESGYHLIFEPRLAEGIFLSQDRNVGACTDISDGFASDVKNIIPAGACAEIYESAVPRRFYGGRRASLKEALCGGEDYELLFSYNGDCEDFERRWSEKFKTPISRIGRISTPLAQEENGQIILAEENRKIFRGGGFDHMAL